MKDLSKEFNLVNEAGEFKSLPAGIYKLKITNVIDKPENEYLEVYSDIVDGEFKGYFSLINKQDKDYSKVVRSYKTNALPFFKAFITAIEKTNNGYKWNWDEKTLVGKYVVGVFGEEEYVSADDEIRTIVKLQEFRSADALKEGKIKVPELKKLPEDVRAEVIARNQVFETGFEVEEATEDDLPF